MPLGRIPKRVRQTNSIDPLLALAAAAAFLHSQDLKPTLAALNVNARSRPK
jgi:hypothetical protein